MSGFWKFAFVSAVLLFSLAGAINYFVFGSLFPITGINYSPGDSGTFTDFIWIFFSPWVFISFVVLFLVIAYFIRSLREEKNKFSKEEKLTK